MGNIANGTINTFVDGDVVSANGTAPALLRSALNPKMEVIRAAINDNDSRIAILEGQVGSTGGLVYNVKSAPFNAVGDGIADDTAAIQSAINTAVANQGIVVIPNGTYKLTDVLTISGTCYITSDGAGQGAILAPSVADKAVFIINSSYVRITDLKFLINVSNSTSAVIYSITGTAPSGNYRGTVIQGCTMYTTNGSYFHGIFLDHHTFGEISNCTIVNQYSGVISAVGIRLRSCSYFIISQNYISSYLSCVQITRSSGSLYSYPQSKFIYIDQNSFGAVVQYGVLLYSTLDTQVTNNNFYTYNSVFMTYIVTDDVDSYVNLRLLISYNTFDGSFASAIGNTLAINLTDADLTTISNNTFVECGKATGALGAVTIVGTATSSTISSNLFMRCQFAGIAFSVNTAVVTTRTQINNNIFVDMYSSTSGAGAAIVHGSLELLSVFGNSMTRGTKSATSVNGYGLYVVTFSTSYGGNGAYISYSGNDFSAATVPVSTVSTSVICIFYEEPTGDRVFKGFSSAPSTGTWRRGDKVLVDDPSASGYIGYVCVTAGTPGTWKGYGAIQA